VVRRVVRRVDPWTVLRFSVLLYASLLVVFIVAGILLWTAASVVGVIDNVEGFMEGIGFTDFRFLPVQVLFGTIIGGLVLMVVGTGLNLLLAVLYNLIADVVGGIEITVLEEDQGPRAVV
jgi:hypothetical protein